MRKIVLATFVLLSLIGCQSDDNNQTGDNNTPTDIKFTTLKKGDASPQTPIMPYYYVLHNQSELETFKDETKTLANVSVDFAVNDVVVVFDEYRYSSGFAIEIKSISQMDSKLTVRIEKSESLDGEPVFATDTQPFHAVRIKKTGLPVVFEENQPQ